jgi:hypothetical protein
VGDSGADVSFTGPSTITIEAGANASAHIVAETVGFVNHSPLAANFPSLVILGPVTFSQAFITASTLGVAQMAYASITGAANVTGPRYLSALNGVVDSNGGGPNYFPGSVAGTTVTGGQYN